MPQTRTIGRIVAIALLVVVGASGCRGVSRPRLGRMPRVQTIGGVSDRPERLARRDDRPSTISSRVDPPPEETGDRIVGRVVDDRGVPVANARVRLAVDGKPGGREVESTTDRDGSFALAGLRPGELYDLIAEWDDGRELLLGRARAAAPDRAVRIRVEAASARPSEAVALGEDRSPSYEALGWDDGGPRPFLDGGGSAAGTPLALPPSADRRSRRPATDDRPPASPPGRSGWVPSGSVRRASLEPDDLGGSPGPGTRVRRSQSPMDDLGLDPVGEDAGPDLPDPVVPADPRPSPVPAAPLPSPERRPSPERPTPAEPPAGADDLDPIAAARSLPPPPVRVYSPDDRRRDDRETDRGARIGEPTAPAPAAAVPKEAAAPPPPVAQFEPEPPAPSEPPRSAPAGLDPAATPDLLEPASEPAGGFEIPIEDRPAVEVVAEPAMTTPEPATPTPDRAPVDPEPAPIDAGPDPVDLEPAAPEAEPPAVDGATPPAVAPAVGDGLPEPAPTGGDGPPAVSEEPSMVRAAPPTEVGAEPPAIAPEATLDPIDDAGAVPPRPVGPGDGPPAPVAVPEDFAEPPRPLDGETTATATPAVRWSELPEPQPLERDERTAQADAEAEGGRGPLGFLRRLAGNDAEVVRASLRFDPESERLEEFVLPDLHGKSFRLVGGDADLVLLCFWGTWCDPCIASLPHLSDLQRLYDPSRLRVVGIAYERNGEGGRRSVSATSRRLGLDFPVLLGTDDGSCPLREALGVMYYPTFVLLDRRGAVVYRGTGATSDKLRDLDRAVVEAIDGPPPEQPAADPGLAGRLMGLRRDR